MHACQAYRQQQQAAAPRVDVVLAVYETFLARLNEARGLLQAQPTEAQRILSLCRLAAGALGTALDPSSSEVAANLQRLYEFITHRLSEPTAGAIDDAVSVIATLRDGFLAVRPTALELERSGAIPSLASSSLQVTV